MFDLLFKKLGIAGWTWLAARDALERQVAVQRLNVEFEIVDVVEHESGRGYPKAKVGFFVSRMHPVENIVHIKP